MSSLLMKSAKEDRVTLRGRPRTAPGDGSYVAVPLANPDLPVHGASSQRGGWSTSRRAITPAASWLVPPQVSGDDVRFQGEKGDDVVAEWNLLKGVVSERPLKTVVASRSSAVPTVQRPHVKASKTGDPGVGVAEAKRVAKAAIETTNFNVAATMSRAGLAKGKDLALK